MSAFHRAEPVGHRLLWQPHHQIERDVVEARVRASRKASRARAAECSRLRRRSSSSLNDWTPKLSRLTPAAAKARQPLGRDRFGIGLEGDLGVGGQRE